MRAMSRRWFVAGVLAGALFSSAALAAGGGGDQSGSSPAPREEPRFKAGDTLVVTAQNAKLMVGSALVAQVPKGRQIVVVQVRDSWVGTYLSVNGQKKAGWIDAAAFMPVGEAVKPEAKLVAASEQVVSEPAQNVVRTRASSGSQRDYFRDYHAGYYGRHETDPNVHVWEPWRQ